MALSEQEINDFFKVGQQDEPQKKQKFIPYPEPEQTAGATNEEIESLKRELNRALKNAHDLAEQAFIRECERQKAQEKAEKAHAEYIQACQQRQNAVKLTNQTRVQLMKGFRDGVPDVELLVYACTAISALTGDKLPEQKAKERAREQQNN